MNNTIKIKKNKGLYLPLFNLFGMKSSITPFFGGDLKLDYHHYLLEPTSELSLYQNQMSRNVIFNVNGKQYFLNGQKEHQENDDISYTTGRLFQEVKRKNSLFTINTISYVPKKDTVELHYIELINNSNLELNVDIITAIPIYARSADNLRDHRQVTSLLNRVIHDDNGVIVKPTLSFDERGHLKNKYRYSVHAHLEDSQVNRIISNIYDFIDGGSMLNPKGTNNFTSKKRDGYEAIGAIGFKPFKLKPNETKRLYLALGIFEDENINIKEVVTKYFNEKDFKDNLNDSITELNQYSEKLEFNLISNQTSELLKWVTVQPVLRRFLGNSYLPHHDYGRGGRGWRDLWQDLLSLIMFNDETVNDLLFDNFAGIRIDGSNATIIGDNPGEFKADRNQITRVWSDHGAWPLLTTKMYIDETGDIEFLIKKNTYFDDQFTDYTKKIKNSISSNNILSIDNKVYKGTILEHLLLQNIVAHFNVGDKGFIRLEDADWNDGLDMGSERGETIAFTHFYANNLKVLVELLEELQIDEVEVFVALNDLIFENINLTEYFTRVRLFNEKTIFINKQNLINQLLKLYKLRINHLNENAWDTDVFQSYINNDGEFKDNDSSLSLTGQAMSLLNNTANIKQAQSIQIKTKRLLFDEKLGGYKLNTNYNKVLDNMGRAYGFAYGHKENGAVFSHMAMMYVYGLYNYNFVKEGSRGYQTLLIKSLEDSSNLLHGIPEYFNDQGVGMYPYLTGSASWLLKLLRDQVFGINLKFGKLTLNPKLSKNEFIENKAMIKTYINGKLITVTYHNPKNLDYGRYKISKVISNDKDVTNSLQLAKINMEVHLDEI